MNVRRRCVASLSVAAALVAAPAGCSGSEPAAAAAAGPESGPPGVDASHRDTDTGDAPSDAAAPNDGPAEAGSSDILVPPAGALLGHFYGNGALAQTDARIGRRPAIHLTYFDWVTDWTADPTISTDFADGRIPLVNWEPFDASGAQVSFDDILGGAFDAMLASRANGAASFHKKLFLDFAAEMNGDEGWGGHDPAKYIAAYRHVHDVFRAAGATNVVWAWCPNVTDVDGTNAATMSYYPGDAYVDWTGVDGYNWGTSVPGFGWQTFHDVFAGIYPLLAAKGKPILIGEMASDEVGGSKAQWIDAIVPTLEKDFPLIRAFVWFDIKKERAWQIDSSPAALAAYSKMALDPFMNP
jgi:hypothetical protein